MISKPRPAAKSGSKTAKRQQKKPAPGAVKVSGRGKLGAALQDRLIPPPGGAVVRMYRIGHGDCFLLAFPGKGKEPVYVMIDCGYKPGSPQFMDVPTTMAGISANIKAATGGRIDVFVVTHEHQDHLNGITEKHFDGLDISEAWFAWTEDPSDELANTLRQRFKDQLVGLVAARNSLGAGQRETVKTIDELLSMEFGGETDRRISEFGGARMAEAGTAHDLSANKKSMKIIKERAAKHRGIKYLRPHEPVRDVPGAESARVMVLGPPRNEQQLGDLDPSDAEEFHNKAFLAAAAASAGDDSQFVSPFEGRYAVDVTNSLAAGPDFEFFERHYQQQPGSLNAEADSQRTNKDIPPVPPLRDTANENASWRRIEKDWLMSAEQFALDMNTKTNNASLVLAFELSKGGKVLLFTADAQRGNWVSWADGTCKDGKDEIETRDLMERTVLLKAGHHGSHNATLNGERKSKTPNLEWVALGSDTAREFTVMITAVRKWAVRPQVGWDHPYPPIKLALSKKASQRVLQTDTGLDKIDPPSSDKTDWSAFKTRVEGTDLYFDYTIKP